jgi:long-chain acyl-CoA synthetase
MRDGVGLLASVTDVPVVPVWIEGTHDILPKGRTWPRRRRQRNVEVRFGAPLRFDRFCTPTQAARDIGQAIAAMQQGPYVARDTGRARV